MSWLQCFDQSYSNVASYFSAASLANGLVPLAFLSPKIIEAIASGTARAGLTVSRLTQTQLCLPKGALRTGLCPQSNQSQPRLNGN
jgi:hypothetical protein